MTQGGQDRVAIELDCCSFLDLSTQDSISHLASSTYTPLCDKLCACDGLQSQVKGVMIDRPHGRVINAGEAGIGVIESDVTSC
eukprot:6146671-Amphidinium_carterae.1